MKLLNMAFDRNELAGHYRFGARTGGALMIIGVIFAILGICYSGVVLKILDLFSLRGTWRSIIFRWTRTYTDN